MDAKLSYFVFMIADSNNDASVAGTTPDHEALVLTALLSTPGGRIKVRDGVKHVSATPRSRLRVATSPFTLVR